MIKKAVIPIAGFGTRFLPITKAIPKEMLPIVNIPVIHFIVQEAIDSGIEEILFVINRHKETVKNYFEFNLELETILREKKEEKKLKNIANLQKEVKISYVYQNKPTGSGEAIKLARDFVGKEHFAVLYGDEFFLNGNALKEVMKVYQQTKNSVIGVQLVSEDKQNLYGIVEVENNIVTNIIEKPKKNKTKSNYANIGRYILSPSIFDKIKGEYCNGKEVYIIDAFIELMKQENLSICEVKAKRYDVGNQIDYVKAIIDYALYNKETKNEIERYIKTR